MDNININEMYLKTLLVCNKLKDVEFDKLEIIYKCDANLTEIIKSYIEADQENLMYTGIIDIIKMLKIMDKLELSDKKQDFINKLALITKDFAKHTDIRLNYLFDLIKREMINDIKNYEVIINAKRTILVQGSDSFKIDTKRYVLEMYNGGKKYRLRDKQTNKELHDNVDLLILKDNKISINKENSSYDLKFKCVTF